MSAGMDLGEHMTHSAWAVKMSCPEGRAAEPGQTAPREGVACTLSSTSCPHPQGRVALQQRNPSSDLFDPSGRGRSFV